MVLQKLVRRKVRRRLQQRISESFYQYVVNSPERLLMATESENVLDELVEKEIISQRRLSSYREKTLHGQYVRGTEEVRGLPDKRYFKERD